VSSDIEIRLNTAVQEAMNFAAAAIADDPDLAEDRPRDEAIRLAASGLLLTDIHTEACGGRTSPGARPNFGLAEMFDKLIGEREAAKQDRDQWRMRCTVTAKDVEEAGLTRAHLETWLASIGMVRAHAVVGEVWLMEGVHIGIEIPSDRSEASAVASAIRQVASASGDPQFEIFDKVAAAFQGQQGEELGLLRSMSEQQAERREVDRG
jgi:hypothetical protein